jgi:diguanylate cyclase (GGDEF)-like protein
VLHAVGAIDRTPTRAEVARLEAVASQAGSRIGMLRVMSATTLQAATDPLTGLLNRRSFENQAHAILRQHGPLALAMGDLDHFKLLNDVHGHDTGDRALRLFARVLRDSVRPNDIPARYGGEEFVAVLPDCSLDDAAAIIERIRARLHHALTDGNVPVFTVSFGLAASESGRTFGETVDAADQALIRAKRNGRDRIEIAAADALTTDPPSAAPPAPPSHLTADASSSSAGSPQA